ncbi:TatD family [Dipodascopsis tothii]|uniref:TatD family n=1 Tax=Dipodascopsis tothii TaxID=44089 RepID=UPI0034CE8DCB
MCSSTVNSAPGATTPAGDAEDGIDWSADLPADIWAIGVHDAHCHPTDNSDSLAHVPALAVSTLAVMATRLDDQDRVAQIAVAYGDRVVPAFGYHPWFSHRLYVGEKPDKAAHYRAVLTPEPSAELLETLPEPTALAEFVAGLRTRLHAHPSALVGEIGLDRSFRLPMPGTSVSFEEHDGQLTGLRLSEFRVDVAHQTAVMLAQIEVAAELDRGISVHGVQVPGILYDALAQLWAGEQRPSKRERRAGTVVAGPRRYPRRICLHSYSGSAEQVKRWTARTVPADVYFSFSEVINARYGARFDAVLRAVPADRLLVESDFHAADKRLQALMAAVVRRICAARGWPLADGVRTLAANWQRFVYGVKET